MTEIAGLEAKLAQATLEHDTLALMNQVPTRPFSFLLCACISSPDLGVGVDISVWATREARRRSWSICTVLPSSISRNLQRKRERS